MILNFKMFNKFSNYEHFKMEFINSVINLIEPNVAIFGII